MKKSVGYNWYFGRVIAYLRKQKGMTQGEYARTIGRDQSVISRIEQGNHSIEAKDLSIYAQPFDLLGTDLHKLASRCFATYKQHDSERDRLFAIERLCDEYEP